MFSVFSNNKFNPNTPLFPTGLLKLQSNLGHNKSYVSTQLTQSNSPVWSIAAVLTDTKELIYCFSTKKKRNLLTPLKFFHFSFFFCVLGGYFFCPSFGPLGTLFNWIGPFALSSLPNLVARGLDKDGDRPSPLS